MADPQLNPYTAETTRLTAALEALQARDAPAMFSDAEIELRRAKQSKAEQLAVLAKLSGDKALGTVGTSLLPEALKMSAPRYVEHGEYDPLSGNLNVFPEYTRRVAEERLARQVSASENRGLAFDATRQREVIAQEARAEAARLEREARTERDRVQREYLAPYKDATSRLQKSTEELNAQRLLERKAAESAGKTLTGQIYKDMRKLGEDVDTMTSIRDSFAKNFDADTSYGMSSVGQAQDWAARQMPGLVSDTWVRNSKAWADLQRLKEMKSRHELFGATLTGNEKGSWDAVTPPRGSTKEQLLDWFTKQDQLIARAIQSEASAAVKGGYSKKQIEEYTRGGYKAPAEVSPVAPSVPASGANRRYIPGQGFVGAPEEGG